MRIYTCRSYIKQDKRKIMSKPRVVWFSADTGNIKRTKHADVTQEDYFTIQQLL